MSKLTHGRCEEVESYNQHDLVQPWMDTLKQVARNKWHERIKKYFEAHGDAGPCVQGAGIYIWHTPPRCRKPRELLFLAPPAVCQGSHTWEESAQEVVEYIRSQGVYCWFEHGRMD
jgi:hypothetical protein